MAIRNWVKGDGVTHEHLNESVDAINNNLPVTGGPGILVRSGSSGTAVTLNTDAFNAAVRVGQIVDAGPNGEDNYTDPDGRHWVKFQANETDDDSYVEYGPLNLVDELSQQPAEIIVTAHNVIDAATSARVMATGQTVYVMRISFDQPESNQLTQLRWIILDRSGTIQVSVGASISRGWYEGHVMNGQATDMNLTGMVTASACYILNGPEYGSTLPPLNPAGLAIGKIFGRGGNTLSDSGSGDDVRSYVLINSFSYKLCGSIASGSG